MAAWERLDALLAQGDAEALLAASRTMRHTGSERRGNALVIRVWRRHPAHPAARLEWFRYLVYRCGPYRGWQWRDRLQLPDDAPAELRAEFAGTEGYLNALLRDFDAAERCFEQAIALDDTNPWLWIERAYTFERADRYDDAMACVNRGLELGPGRQGGIQYKAHLLTLRERHDEAITLLREAFALCTAGEIGMQLFSFLQDRGQDHEAAAILERTQRLMPLADKSMHAWFAARRADLAVSAGDWATAERESRVCDWPFYRGLAERLAASPEVTQQRVLLPVHFIRQHWLTCAPATLAALSHYWGKPADHLAVAEDICYDGTQHYAERQWAINAGFLTREFRLDWPSARALLDAGIPFTLTTNGTAQGHLQAVIGYDLVRNSLLVRDPYNPTHAEFEIDALLENQRAYGPRAMLMVPPEEVRRLTDIELPEAGLWERRHALSIALSHHERETAQFEADALVAVAPGHRITLNALRSLAFYDGDEPRGLEQTEALLALDPDDTNLQLSKSGSLWALGERTRQFEWLESLAARPAPDPHVLARYADRLSEDGRRLNDARRALDRAFRRAPEDGLLWLQKGILEWTGGTPREALPYYRFAATLQETNENHAASYMRTCRLVRETEQGLALLRERVARLGNRSPAPARTLFEQLDTLERTEEAFAVLDAALAAHPNDPGLLLFCADARLRYGQQDEAHALVDRIGTSVHRAAVFRMRALLADAACQLGEALGHAEAASALSPLDLDLHRMVASLRARLSGREAAVTWLREACTRFPRSPGLAHLLYEWIDDADAQAREAVLRDLIAHHPDNLWALRELAIHLASHQHSDEAQAFIEDALVRGPLQAENHSCAGYLALQRQGYDAAAPHLRRAIELDCDNGYSINTLVETAPTLDARRAALAFVWSELLRQVTVGDGLLAYRNAARNTEEPEALLASLRVALQERSDLWQTWVAVAAQLSDMGRSDEALELIEGAHGRFPRLPRLDFEHARAFTLLGKRAEALSCLEKALAIAPAWGPVVRDYVNTVVDGGFDPARAERVLRHALTRGDENPDLRALLGWLLERMERHDEAIEAVRASLRIDPTPSWVWDTARRLFEKTDRQAEFGQLIDEVLKARPGDPTIWAVKAEFAPSERLAIKASERALKIDPRHVRSWIAQLNALLRNKSYRRIHGLLTHTPWGEDAPIEVLAFGPRATRAEGRKDAACEAMTAFVARDGNRYELWHELADWADEDDRQDDYLECSKHLVRLAPTHAVAHGYLGHARMKHGLRREAMPDFRRALELEPGYTFAAINLAELALEFEDGDAARFATEVHAPHDRSPNFAVLRVREALTRRDIQAALSAARDAFERDNDGQYAADAVRILWDAGLRDETAALLHERLKVGECPEDATTTWLQLRFASEEDFAVLRSLQPWLKEDANSVLLCSLVRCCADKRSLEGLAKRLLREHRTTLRANNYRWGLVGWMCLQFDWYRKAVEWQADWYERKECPDWALANLMLANMSISRPEAAFDIARALCERTPGHPAASLWLAVREAFGDLPANVATTLGTIGTFAQDDDLQPVHDLLQGWARARSAERASLALPAFRNARAQLQATPWLRVLRNRLGMQLIGHAKWWQRPWLAYALFAG